MPVLSSGIYSKPGLGCRCPRCNHSVVYLEGLLREPVEPLELRASRDPPNKTPVNTNDIDNDRNSNNNTGSNNNSNKNINKQANKHEFKTMFNKEISKLQKMPTNQTKSKTKPNKTKHKPNKHKQKQIQTNPKSKTKRKTKTCITFGYHPNLSSDFSPAGELCANSAGARGGYGDGRCMGHWTPVARRGKAKLYFAWFVYVPVFFF